MEVSELLPCPFCGGRAYLRSGPAWPTPYMECAGCAIVTCDYQTESEAIAAWNRRTPETGA